jgi:hypothetical protein
VRGRALGLRALGSGEVEPVSVSGPVQRRTQPGDATGFAAPRVSRRTTKSVALLPRDNAYSAATGKFESIAATADGSASPGLRTPNEPFLVNAYRSSSSAHRDDQEAAARFECHNRFPKDASQRNDETCDTLHAS